MPKKERERTVRTVEVLDAFFRSGVYDKKKPVEWPKAHYAVVPASSFVGETPILLRYDPSETKSKQYLELRLITELTERLGKQETNSSAQSVPVKVFMNYSPHSDACKKLVTFLDEKKDLSIHMTIIIAQLFNVDRASIRFTCPKKYWSTENVEELTALARRADVVLKPFEKRDWLDLLTTLVFETRRDEKDWKDLFSALFRRKANTFARLFPSLRLSEDERIREDMKGFNLLQND